MLKFLRTLFGNPAASDQTPSHKTHPSATLAELAPLIDNEARIEPKPGTSNGKLSFVFREVVLDRKESMVGYEFLLGRRVHSGLQNKRGLNRIDQDDLLIRSLPVSSLGSLLEQRLAFFDLSVGSLDHPHLERLPVGNTILLLNAMDGMNTEAVQTKLDYLKGRGFRLGWHVKSREALQDPLLVGADYLEITTPELDGLQIVELVAEIKKLRETTGSVPKVLACDIQTAEDFQVCFQAGCDFFQGPFVSSRKNFHPPKSEIDRVKLMGLLNRLRAGAENDELAEGLRQDAVLTYKILRTANSAAMGMQKEITTTAQALAVMGREKFYRWLSLLLFNVTNPGYSEKTLIEQALVRARLMEQIGLESKAAGVIPDQLFLTGLFSLLHLMLGQPVEQVLEQISLPQAVQQALLANTGPLAPYLALAIACEDGDQDAITAQARICAVDAGLVNDQLMLALSWANEVARINA